MRTVADASALLELLLGAPQKAAIKAAVERAGTIQVPLLCDTEIASGLRRQWAAGEVSPERATEALRDYASLPISRHAHLPLLMRVFELRSNFSSYDATYVALAERLDARLLTTDDRLARATRAHTTVEVLP